MAGLDKDETISFISAARDLFLRFGSTRLLNQAILLCFLGYFGWIDRENAVAYGVCGLLAAAATGFSLHFKAHVDRAVPRL